MINWKRGRLASIGLMAPFILGGGALDNSLVLQPESRLWITGTSTVRGFECTAASVSVTAATTGVSPVSAVLRGQKAVTSATVKVPAGKLDCRNVTMNEHMLKALKAGEHPEIAFRIASYELVPGSAGVRAKLNGTLALGGTSKSVLVESNATAGGDGVLRVVGEHTVKMSEYGLKRPSLMMGTMKVGDDVQVHFDLHLK